MRGTTLRQRPTEAMAGDAGTIDSEHGARAMLARRERLVRVIPGGSGERDQAARAAA